MCSKHLGVQTTLTNNVSLHQLSQTPPPPPSKKQRLRSVAEIIAFGCFGGYGWGKEWNEILMFALPMIAQQLGNREEWNWFEPVAKSDTTRVQRRQVPDGKPQRCVPKNGGNTSINWHMVQDILQYEGTWEDKNILTKQIFKSSQIPNDA